MDEGIFKTNRSCLFGGRRVDIQWLWDIQARVKRLEKACRPPRPKPGKEDAARTPRLPGM